MFILMIRITVSPVVRLESPNRPEDSALVSAQPIATRHRQHAFRRQRQARYTPRLHMGGSHLFQARLIALATPPGRLAPNACLL